MLVDELHERLKSIEPDLTTIQSYWKNAQLENEFQRLNQMSIQEDFWQNPDQTKS